ncbi:MAG: hypothetical protein ACYCXT_11115 [Acidiferrobacteraceae bacterium]
MADKNDVLLALNAAGCAIERAGNEGAGVSEMIGLGVIVRLLSEMLAQIDDEPLPDGATSDEHSDEYSTPY